MGVLERMAVAAAIAAVCVAPAASFGQAGPAAPPTVEQGPDAGAGDPVRARGAGRCRGSSRRRRGCLPPTDFGPTWAGETREHERAPGIGV